jgi:hypothetical protein
MRDKGLLAGSALQVSLLWRQAGEKSMSANAWLQQLTNWASAAVRN